MFKNLSNEHEKLKEILSEKESILEKYYHNGQKELKNEKTH